MDLDLPPPNFPARDAQADTGYDYIKEIARGGYGYVYLFRRTRESGEFDYVAGKFVYRQVFGAENDPITNDAYQRALMGLGNFRSLSADSPYLLRVFDVRQRHDEGYFCYMMELADDVETGRQIHPDTYRPRTLKNELIRHGPRQRLPGAMCIEIALGLARGLCILHEAGYIHRDVRPANIIFVGGIPKLADIDLLAGHDPGLTSYIPRYYAAPERGHSQRADIFSLGKTLYEMSTGLPVRDFPCVPRDIRHWTDHHTFLRINGVIARACARDERQRYPSANHLVEELKQLSATPVR